MQDNFIFDLISDFLGYNSSRDKTNLKAGYLVRGSQNVYKKISGTIANRFGLKRRGAVSGTTTEAIVDSFSESNQNQNATSIYSSSIIQVGQTFSVVSECTLSRAVFYLKMGLGTPTGLMTAKLYALTGTFGTSAVPTGSPLATSDPLSVSVLTASYTLTSFTFSTAYTLLAGTNYAIVFDATSVNGDGSNQIYAGMTSPSGHSGNRFTNTAGVYTADSTRDFCFYVYGTTFSPTLAGVISSFEWKSGRGTTYPLRVANNKLQVESTIADGSNPLWYDLTETSTLLNPALSLTKFCFIPWYEYSESKDRILMLRRDANILHWSGGITKIAGGALGNGTGTVTAGTIGAGGSGYIIGDFIFVGTGTGCVLSVSSVSGDVVTGVTILAAGANYTAGVTYATTTPGAGSGCTFQVTTTGTCNTITKLDATTSWLQDGFASMYPAEKKFIYNGVEYSYSGGEDGSVLYGISLDPSAFVSGSIIIQSVIVSSTDVITGATAPVAFSSNDFGATLEGQFFIGSYTSQVVKISARSLNRYLGFLDFINIKALISGDPDFAIIDSPLKGMIPKDGKMYISAGSSDWYIVTPNSSVPVSFTSPISGTTTAFIQTKVEKIIGTGLTAAISQEFIESVGGDIVYLAQDQQLRYFSTSTRSVFTKKLPSLSQVIQDELNDEDFTGGHLRSIGEFIYITAPLSGRHYMYQIRESVDESGNVVAERIWHPPQISGISRFAEIDGVAYGHSNAYPQIYQVWDTNQWHDDGSISGQSLPYTSVARFSYSHIRNSKGGFDFVGSGSLDKVYFEGYVSNGSNVYGNVYFDYKGASGITAITINTVASPVTFYTGEQILGIGDSSLGENPLGDGLVLEANDQALVPKARTIVSVSQIDCFENEVEIYSIDEDSRWEILRIGTNFVDNGTYPVEIVK